ncbi:MAG: class I SAM-dependent methyltransferase [Nitrosomonadaceae bacterium]|nr:class I SAM-dependent methyltransferase [Nitrosomonadaceae bacterium]
MHPSSMINMRKLFDKYVTSEFVGNECKILDFGGTNIKGGGTYYELVDTNKKIKYYGVDLQAGPGVSIILDDPYKVPLEDNHADVVISGQMFEHCEFFWLSFSEMVRVVRPSGYIFLIAPMTGKVHRYPVDCWRFYPDAYAALAKWGKVELVDAWTDYDGSKWWDQVGAFKK